MSARRSTGGVVVSMTAVAAASGLLAVDPAACALALASGLFALLDGRRARPAPCLAGPAAPGAGRVSPDLRATAVFRAFHGDEPRSAGVRETDEPSDTPGAEPPPEPEEADTAYEEFAAGLEDAETEEISFLPPYVSGGKGGEIEDAGDGAWGPPVADSPLLQELNDVLDPRSRMPMPRRFALGTVAVLRNLLDPDQVSRILGEQRRYPRLRFGDIAVELGLLTTDQRDELVRAQREGVFSDEEIRDAQRRLEAHHARGRRRA